MSTGDFPYWTACCCSLAECRQNGCIRQRGIPAPVGPSQVGLGFTFPFQSIGCICPPRSEETCQRKDCGRKDMTP